MRGNLVPVALAVLLALAGCSAAPVSPESSTSASNTDAGERALDAEERRVSNVLANASNVSGTVPGYASPEATVLARNASGTWVRVRMTYSYEYHCANRSGAVDNLDTRAVYRVTDESVRLVEVENGVKLLCE